MYTPYGTELNEKERKTMRMKRNLKKGLITSAGILVIVGALVFLANTASGQRLLRRE